MPAYRSSRCDLNTCTLLRAMMARRTRRMSSSLLPLNMTPAMTSIHPPLWWNGPLGPLTSGRDLYVVLRELACRMVRHGEAARRVRGVARPVHRGKAHRDLREVRDPAARLSARLRG